MITGSCLPQDHGLPYTLVPHPNRTVAAIQVKEGVVHATEELVVSLYVALDIHTTIMCQRLLSYLMALQPSTFNLQPKPYILKALNPCSPDTGQHSCVRQGDC